MRIGLISDIHSNYEALTTVLSWLADNNVDDIICLGDVVGYGPDPNPCCDLIRESCSVTLMGNHDAAVIGVMSTAWYYEAAREALYWTRKQLSDENFRWLYGLPFTHSRKNSGYFHAAPAKPSDWRYVVQVQNAAEHNGAVYNRLKAWSFVGHSHLTKVFSINGKRTAKELRDGPYVAKANRKLLVNVGSVGQPRDRNPQLCFGIFDDNAQTFEHIRLDYDVKSCAKKIVDRGLAERFARRLFTGT